MEVLGVIVIVAFIALLVNKLRDKSPKGDSSSGGGIGGPKRGRSRTPGGK